MKHKHVEMIKAKTENMELVVFIKELPWVDPDVVPSAQVLTPRWVCLPNDLEIRIKSDGEYFLCLPQHKKECLHWLNGGRVSWDGFQSVFSTKGILHGIYTTRL